MPEMTDWVAHLVGGRQVRRRDIGLMKDVAPGSVERFVVATDHPAVRTVSVELDPEKGNFAGTFTRHMRQANGSGSLDVVVVEVVPDPAEPERFVRLYLFPDGSVTLSTKDLYW
jgi:hypothetical protein